MQDAEIKKASKPPREYNFKKGKSGNPGGRPKLEGDVRALAQQHGKEAILRLVGLMSDDNPRVAVIACQAVLDRAYGKPQQAVDLNGAVSVDVRVSFAD